MKFAEIITKTDQEMSSLLRDLKKEAFNLRFQKTSGQLTNTSRVKAVRKAIAKVNTAVSQRKTKLDGGK